MINHRWSEDIFLKNEIVTDGKSHGMVMFIDWSASMRDILEDTAKQLFILIEFCRKVDIPTMSTLSPSRSLNGRESYEESGDFKCFENNGTNLRKFSLLHFFSSGRNKRQPNKFATSGVRLKQQPHGLSTKKGLSFGLPPLNETVVCARYRSEFKQRHGIDIVNAVFFTDGEGGTITDYYTSGDKHLTDPKTRKVYTVNSKAFHRAEAETILLAMLKDRMVATPSVFDCSTTVKENKLPARWWNTTIVGTPWRRCSPHSSNTTTNCTSWIKTRMLSTLLHHEVHPSEVYGSDDVKPQ